MSAMSRAERIVHIKIAKFRERLRKHRIVRFFLRLEADVLEQRDIAILHVANDFYRHLTNCVMTEDDRLMDQRVQIIADRTKRILLNALSFWATKMRHQNRFRTVLAQVVNGRQALADARVIGDANLSTAHFGRHVEVHPHKDAFPAYIQIAQRQLRHLTVGRARAHVESMFSYASKTIASTITSRFISPTAPATRRNGYCSPIRYRTSRRLSQTGCQA